MVASVAPLVSVHWPLYTVFPASAALFYALYFVGFERFSASCLAEKYDKFSWLNKRIWRQNLCALVHTYALVIVMIVVLARSHAQLIVSAMEGALILARVRRSKTPILDVARLAPI